MLSVTFSGPHFHQAIRLLRPDNGHEAGLLMLFGIAHISGDPWAGTPSRRFVSHQVVPLRKQDIVSSSPHHFTWRKSTFIKLLRMAKAEGLAVAFVHSHRGTVSAFFSDHDDENDYAIAELTKNCVRAEVDVLSIVIDEDGRLVARKCSFDNGNDDIDKITVLCEPRWKVLSDSGLAINTGAFERQSLAFGDGFLEVLSQLNVTVVGAGATGSATAMLLARHGAMQIALIDPDIVELSNVSRLHGPIVSDAEQSASKVAALKREIERIGFGTRVLAFPVSCNDVSVRDVLRASDVIFCCTDDHSGRIYLNRLAYFYNLPVLDMGIGIDPRRNADGNVQSVDARLSYVTVGSTCLLCRGTVDPVRARNEELALVDPAEHMRQLKEGYVNGHDVAEPAVGYITTSVACMAIDELVARLTGYRIATDNRVRKFRLQKDTFPGRPRQERCPLCSNESNWGRADVEPFLDRVG